MCSGGSPTTASSGGGRFNWKNRQQAVTDEFQDLAAVVVNGLGLRVEEGVEERDHAITRKAVGARSEAAQIQGPQHGVDLLACAAADLALQHFRTGLGA